MADTRRASHRGRPDSAETPRPVRLGNVAADGISPSMAGLLDRGMQLRPQLARTIHGCVELRFEEDVSPIRVVFGPDAVTVDDLRPGARPPRAGPPAYVLPEPDVVISGRLPAVVQLASAPLLGGIPSPISARGRAAWRSLTSGAVRIEGRTMLARGLMRLMEL